MVEHHLVGLAPDSRLLIAAEGGMRRIEVEAIGPHPARLEPAAETVGAVDVAGPDAGAEAIERVVGYRHSLVVVLEGGHGQNGPENLLLEDAHLVVAREHRGLHVI